MRRFAGRCVMAAGMLLAGTTPCLAGPPFLTDDPVPVDDGHNEFYLVSTPAHEVHPTVLLTRDKARHLTPGEAATANKRSIYQFIHPEVCQSCQLTMGFTMIDAGSVWNTMPAHTHDRRMEAYLYFDLEADQRVFHFMGEPQQTRHMLVASEQAVISPPWSIHSGAGTKNYSFIWAMGGDNKSFTDMDHIAISDLR